MRIFFSAGEPSGDMHGANLIRALRQRHPALDAVGYGGPQMAAAGCQLHEDLTRLAVMWFLRVLLNLHKFLWLLLRADRYFRDQRPDAVILIDYPGFNWWIARRAKARGIPTFYFAPPQLWAWAGWRVKKMRRYVDHVLCGLPFEQPWYAQRGCRAAFVGHPYFDEVRQHQLDASFVRLERAKPRPLVTILPGSRNQEVTQNLKWFLQAAEQIHRQAPNVRFAIASFKPQQAQIARRMLQGRALPVEVHVGRTPELIRSADCCLAVSGSVSLELLYHTRPTVILYKISPLAYFVQTFFRKVKYITLVNLLVARELFPAKVTPYDPHGPDAREALFPEYLTWQNKSEELAGHILAWLTDERSRQQLVDRLEQVKRELAHGGATARAADYILGELSNPPAPIPRPHFLPAAVGREHPSLVVRD